MPFSQGIYAIVVFYLDPTGQWWEQTRFLTDRELTDRKLTHMKALLSLSFPTDFEKVSHNEMLVTRQFYILYQHLSMGNQSILLAKFYKYDCDEPIWEDIVGGLYDVSQHNNSQIRWQLGYAAPEPNAMGHK